MKMTIDAETARALLDYNPETGVFLNKSTRSQNALAGGESGSLQNSGYVAISLMNRKYLAHRVAFLIMLGRFPDKLVDHKNGIRTDNRWSNLRECSNSQNMHNLHREGKNVYPNGKGFMVKIAKDGEDFYLGTYSSKEEAVRIAEQARDKYHGAFAPKCQGSLYASVD